MKTQRELNLEYWGRVHDMCTAYNEKHGTDVKPWECVRWRGVVRWKHPSFNGEPEQYEIAVTILDKRPVFVGDKVYSKSGDLFDWSDPDCLNQINFPYTWTLTPPAPKRTFMLNGEVLPMVPNHGRYVRTLEFRFSTEAEGDEFISKLLDVINKAHNS